jgi:adenylate cyclase
MFFFSQNKLLKKALKLYAGERVLGRVLTLGEKALQHQGEQKLVTLIFTEVAMFTDVKEGVDPSFFLRFLNDYLEAVMTAITDTGGIIDSMIGDAVDAYWLGDDHAEAACECARQLVKSVDELNARQPELPQIRIRIGINSGYASLGNYGTSHRIKYTVLGDQVNLASRTCSMANGHFKQSVVITENTKAYLPPSFSLVEIETVHVKGREKPLMLYGLDNG